MPDTLKFVVGAIILLAVLGVLLGAVLSHHIGGFMRTVEREAEDERRRREEEDRPEAQE